MSTAGESAGAARGPVNTLSVGSVVAYAFPTVGVSLIAYLLNLYFFKYATDVLLIAPAAMGLIFGGHWLGAAIGAYLGGAFYSLWARYDELWIVAALAVALAGCLSLFVPEDRGREPALQPA